MDFNNGVVLVHPAVRSSASVQRKPPEPCLLVAPERHYRRDTARRVADKRVIRNQRSFFNRHRTSGRLRTADSLQTPGYLRIIRRSTSSPQSFVTIIGMQ